MKRMFVNMRVREHEVNFTKSSEANMKRMFMNIRVREHEVNITKSEWTSVFVNIRFIVRELVHELLKRTFEPALTSDVEFQRSRSDRNFIEISILKFREFQDHLLEVLSDPRLS